MALTAPSAVTPRLQARWRNRTFIVTARNVGPAHTTAHPLYLRADRIDLHVAGMALGIDVAYTAGEVRPVVANQMSKSSRFIWAVALGQDCPRDQIGHVVEQSVDPAVR